MPQVKETMKQLMKSLQLNTNLEEYLAELEQEISQVIETLIQQKVKDLNEYAKSLENELRAIAKPGPKPILGVDYKIPEPIPGPPGYTPQKNVDYFDGYSPKKNVDYFDGKDGSPDTGADIVKKINDLPLTPAQQIDAAHIKNLPRTYKGEKEPFVLRGGSERIRQEDLSSQLDGVTKTFTISQNLVGVVALLGSESPIVYQPTTHFTVDTNAKTITLTASVTAPSSGQVLIAILQTI